MSAATGAGFEAFVLGQSTQRHAGLQHDLSFRPPAVPDRIERPQEAFEVSGVARMLAAARNAGRLRQT
jgi:hypothetical protein